MANIIGNQIKSRRRELGINQSRLAELAGVSLNSLSRLERGEGSPTVALLQKVADVLGLELKLTVKGE